MTLKRRQLAPPRVTTGQERRWLNPSRGLLKLAERQVDVLFSRYLYPHLLGLWNPYSRILSSRFSLAEISLAPPLWPKIPAPLNVLLISDIHTGIFLKRDVLADIVQLLMDVKPHLVAIAGDIVTGRASDLDDSLAALAPLSRAPLGAWFCYGNHDYFGGEAEPIRERLQSIGIRTLRNESAVLRHAGGEVTIAGIDDFLVGAPDWGRLLEKHGTPDLLLAHHPDFFYQAVRYRIPLTLSGHTHGGQIRPRRSPPIVRHSEFCLDEGAFVHQHCVLVVSRGLGSVGLPLRYGADPEAVLIRIQAPE